MSATGLPDSSGTAMDTSPASGPAPVPRVSRAGRDLRAAIAVALALGAAILVSLFLARQAFIGVVAAAIAVATWELAGALRRGAGVRIAVPPVLVGGQAMIWLSWPFGLRGILGGFALTALTCLVWRLRGGAAGYLRDVSASLFTAAYVPMFASFAAMLAVPSDGVARVLCFMLAVIASDTGGYAAGVLRGRHPMAPSISPKKSWEGFAGSLIAGGAAGVITVTYLLGGQPWQGVLFGTTIVVTATIGDLIESMIKRDLGVKDMGWLLPGHGGMMDRLDSLLLSAVAAWLLLSLFV